MHTSKTFFITAAAMAVLPLAASAAVIAVDDFSYSNGNLATNNGGTGWAGAWTNVSLPQATVASGEATFTYTSTGVFVQSESSRVLPATIGAGTTTWIRFDGKMTSNTATSDSYGGLALYSGSANERLLIGKSWPGTEEWMLSARDSGDTRTYSNSTVSISDPGFDDIWVKIVNGAGANDDSINFWINPADTSSEVALGAGIGTLTGRQLDFDRILLRGGSNVNGHSETWAFDNLQITTDFALMVPEPSSALLGGLGLLALLRRRRA
jgi:PEP-CTERM motif